MMFIYVYNVDIQNGRTCNGIILRYNCSCDVDYSGDYCESKLGIINCRYFHHIEHTKAYFSL